MAVGLEHTCALLGDRTLRCWGGNQHGELGTGSPLFAVPSPQPLALASVVQIAAGPGMHACARLGSGKIACWGLNDHGQTSAPLARATVPTPVEVPGLAAAVDVAVGAAHSCAVLGDGTIVCWGSNDDGQLGDGTRIDHAAPARVRAISNAVAVSLGARHTCGLLSDHTVQCWGSNAWGESGSSAHEKRATSAGPLKVGTSTPTPVVVEGLGQATQLALGAGRSCARLQDGTAACWGGSVFAPKPKAVRGLAKVVKLAGAGRHMCALLEGGAARCWGSNGHGQLGDGTRKERREPVDVRGLGGARGIAVGPEHACAWLAGSTALCWGSNSAGKLGDGTREWRMEPTRVAW